MAPVGTERVVTAALTDRERVLLEGFAAGFTPSQIARQIGRAPTTVYPSVRSLLAKLGAATEAHAVAIGYRLGLLEIPPVAPPRHLDPPRVLAYRRLALDEALNGRRQ